ncbi:flagellar protein G [Methanococcus aeolicus]|uniref:Flagellar protein G n=1 Tax=Methanococcus aeolicus (strain ATCC BAA-1280 / DSM 17508 / OCM 812 / Nankai-3) TaxID=419665 RepID=A6UTN2_META3|nr:flagellar protein G [Methanococcus aeolicus]ABR55854.1 flagellar protein G [Methanococcus aeolicus Nankai-3]UXM84040.1 flagellar protein G [Methanococcus aeolicus]
MASNTFSEIIMFVVVLIIAASVSGILVANTHQISLGMATKGEVISSKLSNIFEIINDPENIPRNESTGIISIYIKNTGKTPFVFNSGVTTVLIDGDIKTINYMTAISSASNEMLDPSKIGRIDVEYNTTGYHRLKVVSEYGGARTLKMHIQ